jgi:hypothetical protein
VTRAAGGLRAALAGEWHSGGVAGLSSAKPSCGTGRSSKTDALRSGQLPQALKLQKQSFASGTYGDSSEWAAGAPEVLSAGEVRIPDSLARAIGATPPSDTFSASCTMGKVS